MTENRDMSGALFRNEKQKDTWPDYRGDITINGRKYWLSGWVNEGRNGKYLALKAKPAEEKQEQPRPQGNAYAAARGLEDEVPF